MFSRIGALPLAAVFLFPVLVLGCDCGGPVMRTSCTSSATCSAGETCIDNRCTRPADGGTMDGATSPDAFVCPTASRCGTECCTDAQECAAGTCMDTCASGLRCGATAACCAADQLCIADACTTPGDACREELDCPIDGYCDPALGRCLPGAAARCEYFPPPGVFVPEQQWAWTGSTVEPTSVHVMMAPAVGDLDGDGTPEVAFNTYASGTSYGGAGVLRVVRGDTGVEVLALATPEICPEFGIALGDLDADGTPEIVTAAGPCGAGRVIAVHLDGTVVWQSMAAGDSTPFVGRLVFGAPAIADLDGDGMAEVVVGGTVLEHDGHVRWDNGVTAGSGCCSPTASSPLTAVYDVDGDGRLDVIAGNAVWRGDGTPIWTSDTLVFGYVAVADFGGDAVPDVVVVHEGSVSIRRGTDGTVVWGPVVLPGGGRGGPPTVADFDGDGLPEIGVAGSLAYAVFDPDGPAAVLWQNVTQDASSNVTGSSVFDFDGDGRAEVVYNDECYMRVYDGTTGMVLAEVPQNSHTLIEYPLIVDVDADGNAEIVFAANAEVNRCSGIPGYTGLQAGIRVFRDASDNWVGTRPVWNEHTYHVTNVRSDLSIPEDEIANFTRYNTFRQNSQSFDAPDLQSATVSADGSGCNATLVLRARIENFGAVSVSAGLAVTFYVGTVAAPGRAVGTVRTTGSIPPGGSETVVLSFTPLPSELGRDLPFFARADDTGAGEGEQNECLEDNNTAEGTYSCTGVE